MSYDLNFWKYKKGTYLNNQTVYESCTNEEFVDGLEDLPIDLIIKDIKLKFKNWENLDKKTFENTSGNGAFQIFTTKQFVRFDCYGIDVEDMNRIIDVMIKYNCPLYDPQVLQRFDQR